MASNDGLDILERDIARLQASLNNDKAGLKRLHRYQEWAHISHS